MTVPELLKLVLTVLDRCDPGEEEYPITDGMADGKAFCELSVRDVRELRSLKTSILEHLDGR